MAVNLAGEHRIAAPREEVWRALNDPAVLRAAIPGCQEIERESESVFRARVKAKIGPVAAAFRAMVTLHDLDPPAAYTIRGQGEGGVAGFARGGARVTLAEDGGATLLSYRAEGQVGGRLAQLGQRLVEGSARKIASDFFTRLEAALTGGAPGGDPTDPPRADP